MKLPKCDVCGMPVQLQNSVLSMSFQKIRDVQEKQAEWKKNHPGQVFEASDIMTYPERVSWVWHHAECNVAGASYQIEGSRIDNIRRALHWTIHLQDKTWFKNTDWREVIHRLYPECDSENGR